MRGAEHEIGEARASPILRGDFGGWKFENDLGNRHDQVLRVLHYDGGMGAALAVEERLWPVVKNSTPVRS